MQSATQPATTSKAKFWTGWVLSILPALLLLMSATMKLTHNPQAVEGFKHFGYADSAVLWIGVTELVCTVIYLIPRTAVFGAILLTAYLGGAVNTHVRVGEIQAVGAILTGVFVWLGLYLREPRLHALVPFRK